MKKLLFLIMSISTVWLSFAMEKELERYIQEKTNQRSQNLDLQLREQEKVLQEYVDNRPYVNRDKLLKYFRETGYTLMEAIVKKDTSEMGKVIASIPSELRPILVNGFVDKFMPDDDSSDLSLMNRVIRKQTEFLQGKTLIELRYEHNKRTYPHLDTLLRGLKSKGLMLTPLRIAIITKGKKILKALFECGVPIDLNKGFPLQIAIEYNAKAIPFLLQKGAVGIDKALYYAVVIGQIDAAKELLQAGASLNSRDSMSNMTPLHAACVKGNSAMVNFFLEKGAFIDEIDPNGLTPLHWAVEHEEYLIADFLLEHGANVVAKDKAGRTVIECMSSKSFDAKKGVWLLGCGAPYPTTAFHRDIMEDRGTEPNKNLFFVLKDSSAFFKNYFRALIKNDTKGALAAIDTKGALAAIKKARVNDINKKGPTAGLKPLHWAVVRNNQEVVEALVVNPAILQTLASHLPTIISLYVNNPVDINCRDEQGRTPLMWAARLGYIELYRILARAGAKVAYVDKKGKMALNYAADYRNIDIIREMIIDGTLSAKPVTNQN